MPKLPSLRPREIISFLKANGFDLDRVTGSHFIFYNASSRRRAVISRHDRDIPKGTLISLLREAGFSREDIIKFMD